MELSQKPVTTGRQVSALLLNNGSAKIQEIIQTLNMHDKDKRFQLSIEVGSIINIFNDNRKWSNISNRAS